MNFIYVNVKLGYARVVTGKTRFRNHANAKL